MTLGTWSISTSTVALISRGRSSLPFSATLWSNTTSPSSGRLSSQPLRPHQSAQAADAAIANAAADNLLEGNQGWVVWKRPQRIVVLPQVGLPGLSARVAGPGITDVCLPSPAESTADGPEGYVLFEAAAAVACRAEPGASTKLRK